MRLALPEVSLSPEVYDLVETTARDLPLWLALARRHPGPVLELGCGTGRVTWALAQAGVDVTGVDACEGMLARARARRPAGVEATLVRADVRALDLGRRFALVLAPARVAELIGDLPAVVAAAWRHLLPGGRLALHVARPPSPAQPETSLCLVRRDAQGEVLWEERLDRAAGARRVVITHRAPDGRARGFGPLSFTWFEPDAIARALRDGGLVPDPDQSLERVAREAEPGLDLVLARGVPCP